MLRVESAGDPSMSEITAHREEAASEEAAATTPHEEGNRTGSGDPLRGTKETAATVTLRASRSTPSGHPPQKVTLGSLLRTDRVIE